MQNSHDSLFVSREVFRTPTLPPKTTFQDDAEVPSSETGTESTIVLSRRPLGGAAERSKLSSEPAAPSVSSTFKFSPSISRLSVQIYATTPGCVVATVGDVVVSLVRYTMNEESLNALERACQNSQKRYGRFGYFSLLEVSVPLPRSEAVQSRIEAVVARYTDNFYAAAIAYEGHGFEATVVRSSVTAVNLSSRSRHPSRVFSRVLEALSWLRATGACPAPRRSGAIAIGTGVPVAGDAADLARAIAQLRANWRI